MSGNDDSFQPRGSVKRAVVDTCHSARNGIDTVSGDREIVQRSAAVRKNDAVYRGIHAVFIGDEVYRGKIVATGEDGHVKIDKMRGQRDCFYRREVKRLFLDREADWFNALFGLKEINLLDSRAVESAVANPGNCRGDVDNTDIGTAESQLRNDFDNGRHGIFARLRRRNIRQFDPCIFIVINQSAAFGRIRLRPGDLGYRININFFKRRAALKRRPRARRAVRRQRDGKDTVRDVDDFKI